MQWKQRLNASEHTSTPDQASKHNLATQNTENSKNLQHNCTKPSKRIEQHRKHIKTQRKTRKHPEDALNMCLVPKNSNASDEVNWADFYWTANLWQFAFFLNFVNVAGKQALPRSLPGSQGASPVPPRFRGASPVPPRFPGRFPGSSPVPGAIPRFLPASRGASPVRPRSVPGPSPVRVAAFLKTMQLKCNFVKKM